MEGGLGSGHVSMLAGMSCSRMTAAALSDEASMQRRVCDLRVYNFV